MRRARWIGAVVGVVLAGSGLALAVVDGPWAWRIPSLVDPARAGLWLATAEIAAIVHLVVAVAASVGAIAWAAWVLRAPRVRLAVGGLALAAGIAVAHLVPWDELPPWAPRPGAELARPVVLDEAEGPFPELVGVAYAYGRGWYVSGPLSLSGRGVWALGLLHGFIPAVGFALLLRRS